ncbi:hypothetical protein RR46_04068 [Papilio xuthus]|uniref:Retrotransposon gag domain-containing protein n=1 Tax=Papilio xuthus TaxID=66420 RepID=A0A194QHG8_PAPXU|nr:hypothetical protein RR46_04068 [Papilio xuthus]
MPKDESNSEVDLNILIKFIDKFDGNREQLNPFLSNCRNAINLASTSQQNILLKYILSQLRGHAEIACTIKEFENWPQLEEFLKSQFGNTKHYAALLSDMQECRQLNNETVHQFALRIESCLSKLLSEINISIPTSKKGELTGRVAAMQDLALHTFVTGLNPRLSTVVRCRDPKHLNDAINFASSEEKISQASQRRNTSFNQSPNQNLNRSRPFHPLNRNPQNGTNRNHNGDYPTPARPNDTPVCRYCKFPGHTIEVCRKREYNNKRFGNAQNKSNNYRPMPSTNFQNRNQPVHLIDSFEANDSNDNPLNE